MVSGGKRQCEVPSQGEEPWMKNLASLSSYILSFYRGFPISEPQRTCFLGHRTQGRRKDRVDLEEQIQAIWPR